MMVHQTKVDPDDIFVPLTHLLKRVKTEIRVSKNGTANVVIPMTPK